jgi:hypothetical protein
VRRPRTEDQQHALVEFAFVHAERQRIETAYFEAITAARAQGCSWRELAWWAGLPHHQSLQQWYVRRQKMTAEPLTRMPDSTTVESSQVGSS